MGPLPVSLPVVLTLLAGSAGHASAGPAQPAPSLIAPGGIVAAREYARSRQGVVAFAVLDGQGRLRGLNPTTTFPSASVVKAMLLVATLRGYGRHAVSAADRGLLEAMITRSDNDAALVLYDRYGDEALRRVGRAAHMTRLGLNGYLFGTRITAADQARFFLRIDRLVPTRHRGYARTLLSSIVSSQRWGIAPAARAHGMRIFFKGGWRTGLVHQVALLEKGGRRIALAILTEAQPSMSYGVETLAGIARRVLR